jgi:hypothetical protein
VPSLLPKSAAACRGVPHRRQLDREEEEEEAVVPPSIVDLEEEAAARRGWNRSPGRSRNAAATLP